jgi:hypothetical protein
LALVGTAIAAYWLGRHTGHDHSSQLNEIISQNNTIKGQNNTLLREVGTMKPQLDADTTRIGRMADRIRELKSAAKADHRLLSENHSLLVGLRHDEAKEAVLSNGGIKFSGGTHTDTLNFNGDTISNHAEKLIERRTGRVPDWDLIKKVTSKILHMNGFRWHGGGRNVDAHNMAIGLHFKMPNKIS